MSTAEETPNMPPKWFDNDFLQRVLLSFKNKKCVEILNFKIASSFSEHYASEMFQCRVVFRFNNDSTTETLEMVVKAMPDNEESQNSIVGENLINFFKTEIRMYTKVIPMIFELFETNGLKGDFAPELIYASEEPFPIVILKDMSSDGFASYREPPENIEDSYKIIQRLAQFHAASFYLTENNKVDFSSYIYSIFDLKFIVDNLFKDMFAAFREVLLTWEGFENFLPRIDFLAENTKKFGKQCYVPNKPGDGYNVLNHADFHLRNILMKMNSEKRLEDFRFIDFQTCSYCSPAVDINYMFGIARLNKNGEIPKDDMVELYHKEFTKTLEVFGYSNLVPSLTDLKDELNKHGKLSVYFEICFTPFHFLNQEEDNLDELLQSSHENSMKLKKKLYENPILASVLKKGLKSWLSNGWLEIE